MKQKMLFLLELIIIIAAMAYYSLKIMIPEYKQSQGSSDHFIKSSKVANMIEIKIDSTTDFAIILDSEGNIYHMFFFDNSSLSLYNKNIESKPLDKGLEIIIENLIEDSILKNGSQIEILYVNDQNYSLFKEKWNNLIAKYSLTINTKDTRQSIEEKALTLGIDPQSTTSIFLEMDFYSKEIIKNNIDNHEALSEEKALNYTNSIYSKIEEMLSKNHDTTIDNGIAITLIPADNNHQYYPTTKSWYKIVDEKVYAFIELKDGNSSYSYCYKGSINERVKGECKE